MKLQYGTSEICYGGTMVGIMDQTMSFVSICVSQAQTFTPDCAEKEIGADNVNGLTRSVTRDAPGEW